MCLFVAAAVQAVLDGKAWCILRVVPGKLVDFDLGILVVDILVVDFRMEKVLLHMILMDSSFAALDSFFHPTQTYPPCLEVL